jgi:hypothetical protein
MRPSRGMGCMNPAKMPKGKKKEIPVNLPALAQRK